MEEAHENSTTCSKFMCSASHPHPHTQTQTLPLPPHFLSGDDKANMISSQYDQLVARLYREIEIRDSRIQEAADKYNMTCSTTSRVLEGLVQQVESQNERIVELESRYFEKEAAFADASRLLARLTNEIDWKSKEIAQLEHHCNKMHCDVTRLMEERYNTNKYYLQESRKMQAAHLQNKRLKSDIKTVEIELQQLIQGMDGAISGQKQSSPMNLVNSVRSQIQTLKSELVDKKDDVQYLQDLSETLIFKEHMINNELLDARQELLSSLQTVVSSRTLLGIKRMGELNVKPFRDACASKFTGEDCAVKCAEVCSLWEDILKDSLWHPFKQSPINGSIQEIIDENDTRLEVLRKEWGEEVYKAVTSALLELNE